MCKDWILFEREGNVGYSWGRRCTLKKFRQELPVDLVTFGKCYRGICFKYYCSANINSLNCFEYFLRGYLVFVN